MPVEMTIDLSELEAFEKDLQTLEPFIGQELEAVMVKALAVLKDAIDVRTPSNTGNLRGSLTSQRFGDPLATYTGEVLTSLQYGLPVEHGRRAGKMPPVSAIKMWVVRKLGLRGKAADSAAFLIARAIGRRGTKGAFMFQKGFDAALPSITALYDAVPGKIIARLAGGAYDHRND